MLSSNVQPPFWLLGEARPGPVVLKLRQESESSGECWAPARISDSVALGKWGARILIFIKFQGDADAAGQRTSL